MSVVSIPERTPALEWAPYGITVNAILPGSFATEVTRPLLDDPEKCQSFVTRVPLDRFGEPEEIDGLVLFLASDAFSFVTGAGVVIDGGWTAH